MYGVCFWAGLGLERGNSRIDLWRRAGQLGLAQSGTAEETIDENKSTFSIVCTCLLQRAFERINSFRKRSRGSSFYDTSPRSLDAIWARPLADIADNVRRHKSDHGTAPTAVLARKTLEPSQTSATPCPPTASWDHLVSSLEQSDPYEQCAQVGPPLSEMYDNGVQQFPCGLLGHK